MGTILYHGSRSLDVIDKVDLTRAKEGFSNSEYGVGFYTSLNHADGMSNAGWPGGTAGWMYELKVPGDYTGYSKGHDGRWMSGFEDVDRKLMERVTGAMKDIGGKFSERGEKLMEQFNEGKLDWTGRNLVKNLQNEFGFPKAGSDSPTSADIWIKAGIDGARVNGGGYFLFLNPQTIPQPLPCGFGGSGNPAADALGGLLRDISIMKEIDEYNRDDGSKKLDTRLSETLRHDLAGIITDALKGGADIHERTLAVTRLLEQSGADLSKEVTRSIAKAEVETARADGLTSVDVARRREAEEIVKERPAREKGEGFLDYKDRVYAWHDATHKGATEAQQDAFTTALFGALYRDVQRNYADRTADALAINNDPAKLERMLARETPSRDMGAIQHIEYDLDTLQPKEGYRKPQVQPASPRPVAAAVLK